MTKSSYEASLRRLLVHEGGYTDNARDPGGPTNFGITLADYRRYVKPGAGAADVRAMPVEDAERIYRTYYWNAMRCDDLPAGIDDTVFDYGVNSGIGRAKKVLQRVVGVNDDDVLGPQTMQTIAKCDPRETILAVNAERLRFLQSLRTWPVFGKGWSRRVAEVQAYSLQLAAVAAHAKTFARTDIAAAPLPVPSASTQQTGKGIVPLPPVLRIAAEKKNKIAAAGVSAAIAGVVTWWHWCEAHPFEAAAMAACGCIFIGGVGYAVARIHNTKQEAPAPDRAQTGAA